jgi:hypothetical protein
MRKTIGRMLLTVLCLLTLTSITALADGTTPMPDCPKGFVCLQ